MRAKPISFAQVLKTKTRPKDYDVSSQSTLAEMMQQFEESPSEDFTLYLGPVSQHNKNKVSSFRAIGSKASNHDQSEIFDSWIQKQSFVSNKENHLRQLGTSRNHMESQREGREAKKIVLSSKGKEGKEQLKSVADLVRKIELTESNTNAPFFKASSKHPQLSERIVDEKPTKREEPQGQRLIQQKQNQPTSFRANNYEVNVRGPSPKVPEKPSAKPYIQQPTVTKQRPQQSQKDELKQLIAKTQYIHLQIAQMAQDYMQAEAELQEKEEDSLLIENSDKKEPQKVEIIVPPVSTIFTEGEETKLKEEKERWEAAKNRMNLYLKKITHDQSQGSKHNNKPSKPQTQNLSIPNPSPITIPHNSVGYSFAVNEVPTQQRQEKPWIPALEFVSIPRVQQIQSQRMPYEYNNFHEQSPFLNSPPLIPQGQSIPNIQSVRVECYASPVKEPQHHQMANPSASISAKRINSSLMFSENMRDTPSPQSSEQKELVKKHSGESQQQCVSLSFTQEKPQIVVNIPLNYAEQQPEEFQLETVDVKKQSIQDNYFASSPSPSPSPSPQKMTHFSRERMNYEYNDVPTEEIPIQPMHSSHFEVFPVEETEETKTEVVFEGFQATKVKLDEVSFVYKTEEPYYLVEEIKPTEPVKQSYEPSCKSSMQASLKQSIVEQPPIPLQVPKEPQLTLDNLSDIPLKQDPPSTTFVPSVQPITSIAQMRKSLTKNSVQSSKGSPGSMFGLKKVYSSPKTQPVPAPPVSTSAFTTSHEFKLTKIEIPPVDKLKYNNTSKHYEKKIETVAYSYSQFKKEEPKPAIEEEDNQEFQFDF